MREEKKNKVGVLYICIYRREANVGSLARSYSKVLIERSVILGEQKIKTQPANCSFLTASVILY